MERKKKFNIQSKMTDEQKKTIEKQSHFHNKMQTHLEFHQKFFF